MNQLANKMLHRGPFNRLTAIMNGTPVLSTCLLLLLQSQIFHALPTSSSSSFNDDAPLLDKHFTQGSSSASSPSTSYLPTYSYSSYRPGARLESYRPYRDYFPKEDAAPAGLYIGDSIHPNSVYSPQSPLTSSPQNQDKVLQYIEKEILDQEVQNLRQKYDSQRVTLKAHKEQGEETQDSPVIIPRRRDNKPKLAPLPSISQVKAPVVKVDEKKEDYKHLEPLPTNPIPPPFAPELDPQYERRQYGLGALTLLDQAGPFW